MLTYYNEKYIMINKSYIITIYIMPWYTNVNLLQWTVHHDKQMLSYYNEEYIIKNKY